MIQLVSYKLYQKKKVVSADYKKPTGFDQTEEPVCVRGNFKAKNAISF